MTCVARESHPPFKVAAPFDGALENVLLLAPVENVRPNGFLFFSGTRKLRNPIAERLSPNLGAARLGLAVLYHSYRSSAFK